MTFKNLIKKYAVPVYGILTISASWLVWSRILTILEPGELLTAPTSEAMTYVALGGIVPSLIGVLMTLYLDGLKGLRELWARMTNWKLNPWLYLAACLPMFMTLASNWLQQVLGIGSASPDVLSKIPAGLGIGFFAALGEEFGWRGFALPRLSQRYRPLTAGLLVGLLWGVWHIYPDYIGLGNLGWQSAPLIFILGPVLLTIFAVIMAWLHHKGQNSMLLMLLFHLNISSSAFALARETATYGEQILSSLVTPLIGLLVIAVILGLQSRRNKPAVSVVAAQ